MKAFLVVSGEIENQAGIDLSGLVSAVRQPGRSLHTIIYLDIELFYTSFITCRATLITPAHATSTDAMKNGVLRLPDQAR